MHVENTSVLALSPLVSKVFSTSRLIKIMHASCQPVSLGGFLHLCLTCAHVCVCAVPAVPCCSWPQRRQDHFASYQWRPALPLVPRLLAISAGM